MGVNQRRQKECASVEFEIAAKPKGRGRRASEERGSNGTMSSTVFSFLPG